MNAQIIFSRFGDRSEQAQILNIIKFNFVNNFHSGHIIAKTARFVNRNKEFG
jgi:hypothetical protein